LLPTVTSLKTQALFGKVDTLDPLHKPFRVVFACCASAKA
jgi:hypothetical protein